MGLKQLQYRERKQFWKKMVYLLLTLLFLIFVAGAMFGDSGILVNMRVKTDYQALLEERDRLLEENTRLAREIRELKTNDRAIEALGRKEFGFAKPGEIVFFFPEDAELAVQRYEVP